MPTAFLTGGTGLLGSHLAERLTRDGYKLRCLVRKTSDTSLLESLGAELVTGDLADENLDFGPFLDGVDYVFHVAANVDDWGEREIMYRINVLGLKKLLDAVCERPVERVVYVSSMAVLGMGEQVNVNEDAPYVYTGDNYNYTKIEAEKLARSYHETKGMPIVIIRPPYIYGPRDRQFFPRLVGALRDGTFAYIGGGNIEFTLVYVGNLVEALMLAATKPGVEGRIYMITDGEAITRRELVEMICDELGLEKPTRSFPVAVARLACPIYELTAKLLRRREPPRLNRFRLKFMATRLTFDISRARKELGYEPVYKCRDALRETIRWFKSHGGC